SHRPLPPNTLSPDFAWSLMAALSPARNRSSGVWSETSVASQVWIASPQKSEKLNSIIVYERPVAGSVRLALEFHHFGWKACRIRSAYEVPSPVPEADECGPSTLSVALTRCSPSGCSASSFLPMSLRLRPAADI